MHRKQLSDNIMSLMVGKQIFMRLNSLIDVINKVTRGSAVS